MQTEEIISSM